MYWCLENFENSFLAICKKESAVKTRPPNLFLDTTCFRDDDGEAASVLEKFNGMLRLMRGKNRDGGGAEGRLPERTVI